MTLKLNKDGSITIEPQRVPEISTNIFVNYVFPKGLNHLTPVLWWGQEIFRGNNIRINKPINTTTLKTERLRVGLFDDEVLFKSYELKKTIQPMVYIGYNVKEVNKDIINYIETLEAEVRELKERGDIV